MLLPGTVKIQMRRGGSRFSFAIKLLRGHSALPFAGGLAYKVGVTL